MGPDIQSPASCSVSKWMHRTFATAIRPDGGFDFAV
jgi:hypothetical protein